MLWEHIGHHTLNILRPKSFLQLFAISVFSAASLLKDVELHGFPGSSVGHVEVWRFEEAVKA
jgi:hypothetical protein